MNEHPDKRHALIERIEKKGLQVFGANAVSHEDEKIVLEALKAFTPSHAPRIGDECADLKAELQRKYPDPLPKDRRLLYYMEAAEAWGQLARDLEDRLERCAEAYGEAHGRAAEMAESIRAESMPSATRRSIVDELLRPPHVRVEALDFHGLLWGIRLTDGCSNGCVELYLEDDDFWHLKATFDRVWLEDLRNVIEFAEAKNRADGTAEENKP